MSLEKAVQFVRQNGNEVEQARLRYILTNELPSREIIGQLLAGQRSDGGWRPPWAKDYSSLDATWSSEDGPGYDVHVTLEALRAFQFSGWKVYP